MIGDDRRLFEDLSLPPVPEDLKTVTVERCRFALAGNRPAADIWSRAWNHRGLRFGWAAAVAALLLINVAIRQTGTHEPAAETPRLITAGQTLDPEVRSLVELPAIDFGATFHGGVSRHPEEKS